MARSKKVEARERARAAKAKFDAEREQRDKQITAYTEDYFLAVAERDEAVAAVAAAEATTDGSVVDLIEGLGLPVSEAAQLCDLTVGEVRAMRKRVASSRPAGVREAEAKVAESPAKVPAAAAVEAAGAQGAAT